MINDRPLPWIMSDALRASKAERLSRVWRWGGAIGSQSRNEVEENDRLCILLSRGIQGRYPYTISYQT